jgi:hypothetical protein
VGQSIPKALFAGEAAQDIARRTPFALDLVQGNDPLAKAMNRVTLKEKAATLVEAARQSEPKAAAAPPPSPQPVRRRMRLVNILRKDPEP